MSASEFAARLKDRGVLMNIAGPLQLRLLTHYDADRAACESALSVIEDVAQTANLPM
jgi:threonine aldolase